VTRAAILQRVCRCGIAYVYDVPAGNFASKCNMEMVKLEPVLTVAEEDKQVYERAMWHSEQRGGQGVEG
jgi:glutamate synthase domain-containing protein 3